MWLDLKKCTFVIFVITMFSLLAVQPAFSLESDFVSTGNSTVGVPTTTSYADLLNGNINNNPQDLKFDNVSSNKVILRQGKNNNILNDSGDFNIDFKIPQGHKFTIEIVTSNGISGYLSKITVSVDNKSTEIDTENSGIYKYSYFLIHNPDDSITYAEKEPDNNSLFGKKEKESIININGHCGYLLQVYIIFKDLA